MLTRLCLISLLVTLYACITAEKNHSKKKGPPRVAVCNEYQFLCKFGSQCIDSALVCDGRPDCKDKSDETFTLCAQVLYDCPRFAFKCSYGACVGGDAKCNGVYDCADHSDELLKECPGVAFLSEDNNCKELEFACVNNTQCIPSHSRCDGVVDCKDGSDETLTECSQVECPAYAFRCAYGACVAGDAPCDGSPNCRDGSDEIAPQCPLKRLRPIPLKVSPASKPSEAPEVIKNQTTPTTSTTVSTTKAEEPTTVSVITTEAPTTVSTTTTEEPATVSTTATEEPTTAVLDQMTTMTTTDEPIELKGTLFRPCSLPPPPGNGSYTSSICEHEPNHTACSRTAGAPVYPGLLLQFSCAEGFSMRGNPNAICTSGFWYPGIPRCSDECEPLLSTKLQITCIRNSREFVPCDKTIRGNTTAIFRCETWTRKVAEPGYNRITCRSGTWDRPLVEHFCQPACGKAPSEFAEPLVRNGKLIRYGQFPWHVGIYSWDNKRETFEQGCGGTIVSVKLVVSAAHCFYSDSPEIRGVVKRDESTFRVAAGKYYRNLDAEEDTFEKVYEVAKIEAPFDYRGSFSRYLGDIAFVFLKTPIEYSYAVRPVCLDIGKFNFEQDQLVNGAIAKVVGWGLTADGAPSDTLLLAELPYVPRTVCKDTIGTSLFYYVTEDKFCAGNQTSQVSVCRGDSGGGLVVEDVTTKTYYLRGVVSSGGRRCQGQEYSIFTKVSTYSDVLTNHLNSQG